MIRLLAVAVGLLSLAAVAAPDNRAKLVVLDLQPNGVEPVLAKALGDAITTEVSRRGYFQVISSEDVRTLISVERQRQLMGCGEEAQSCLAELAGALGAQLTLSGSVGRIGDSYQLTLQTLDSQKGTPLGRTTRVGRTPEDLREAVPYAVAEATGTPLPQPPSRVLPITMMAGGAAMIIGGGVLGLQAINSDSDIHNELVAGLKTPELLRSAEVYRADIQRVQFMRTLSLATMITGAALIGGGVLLLPKGGGGGELALVFNGNGVGLAGVFP